MAEPALVVKEILVAQVAILDLPEEAVVVVELAVQAAMVLDLDPRLTVAMA